MKFSPWDRLTWTVRWRFSPQEADEILDDYRELLSGRPPEDVRQVAADFGRPTEYGLWLARFWGMAGCLALPLLWNTMWFAYHQVLSLVLAATGAALALSLGKKEEERQLGRGLWALLVVQAALLGAVFGLFAFFCFHMDTLLPLGNVGPLLHALLQLISLLAGLLGLAGLVLTRVEDRRWRAVYVLGLTVLAVTSILLAVMGSMDVSAPVTIEGLWRYCMVRMVPTALVGLGATGAALC